MVSSPAGAEIDWENSGPPKVVNLQVRGGQESRWLCGTCKNTLLTRAEGECLFCERGEPLPDYTPWETPPKIDMALFNRLIAETRKPRKPRKGRR